MLIGRLYKSFYEGNSFFSFKKRYFLYGSLISSYIGYQCGYLLSDKENKEVFLTPFENEDSIIKLFKDQSQAKPLLIYYYVAGNAICYFFRECVLNVAKQYNKEVNFMKINCKTHYNYVRQKSFDQGSFPMVELLIPNKDDSKGYDLYKLAKNRDLTEQGIISFLEV